MSARNVNVTISVVQKREAVKNYCRNSKDMIIKMVTSLIFSWRSLRKIVKDISLASQLLS
jgi:hypothetical protein